ncbi:MAG: hypothetical protein IPG27_21405 [Ottowia sp.]|nr:hypothetical protein [Ottowia sp.]
MLAYPQAVAKMVFRRPELEHGHWYIEDGSGALFIVPDDSFGAAEIEGPDGETLDRLNAAYRRCDAEKVEFGRIHKDGIARVLGLTVVQDWQHRFDQRTGRYFTV